MTTIIGETSQCLTQTRTKKLSTQTVGKGSILYARFSDYEALEYYRSNSSSMDGQNMLQELLRRHFGVLKSIAQSMAFKYASSNTFDDFMQHANVGAIIAYNKFDLEMKHIQVTSYLRFAVTKYLIDAMNHDAFIHCPTHKRAWRSYFAGRYDNDQRKKREFEQKHGLTTPEDIEAARNRHSVLRAEFQSLDVDLQNCKHYGGGGRESRLDALTDNTEQVIESIVDRLDIEAAMRSLSERQRMVCQLVMEQDYTYSEAATALSKQLNQDITDDMVRGDVRTIRRVMRNSLEG